MPNICFIHTLQCNSCSTRFIYPKTLSVPVLDKSHIWLKGKHGISLRKRLDVYTDRYMCSSVTGNLGKRLMDSIKFNRLNFDPVLTSNSQFWGLFRMAATPHQSFEKTSIRPSLFWTSRPLNYFSALSQHVNDWRAVSAGLPFLVNVAHVLPVEQLPQTW